MARNVTRSANQLNAPAREGEVPPMVGGTLGVVETVKAKLSALPRHMQASAKRHAVDAVPTRRYRVVGGPELVMYRNCKTRLQRGKLMSDANCDIELLRSQGVVFEELKPEPKAAPVVTEVAAEAV